MDFKTEFNTSRYNKITCTHTHTLLGLVIGILSHSLPDSPWNGQSISLAFLHNPPSLTNRRSAAFLFCWQREQARTLPDSSIPHKPTAMPFALWGQTCSGGWTWWLHANLQATCERSRQTNKKRWTETEVWKYLERCHTLETVCGKSQTGGRKYVRANRGSKRGGEGVEATTQPEAAVELRPKYSPCITSGQTEGARVHDGPFFNCCGFAYAHVHSKRKKLFCKFTSCCFSDKQVLSRLSNFQFISAKAFS